MANPIEKPNNNPSISPSGPEKIIKDFGLWPEEDVEDGWKEKEFDEFVEKTKVDKASISFLTSTIFILSSFNLYGLLPKLISPFFAIILEPFEK